MIPLFPQKKIPHERQVFTMKIEKMKIEQIKEKLTRNPKTKKVEATINNVILILENDPRFAGRIRFNRLTQRQELKGKNADGRSSSEDITEIAGCV